MMRNNVPLLTPQSPDEGAGYRQGLASNPMKSHWVGASAGTGKTKVLVDRLLRLMLPRPHLPLNSATPPARILCLTFTKTAAAEMSNRIYEKLGDWAVMPDEDLREELTALIGQPPSEDIEQEARRLFARVLDTPGGMKIMTIHSFCQSVLKRFPVEAGIAPHFEMMDEKSAVEYLTRCQHDLIIQVRRDTNSDMAKAFSLLAVYLDSTALSDLMSKMMSARSVLTGIFEHHGDTGRSAEKTVAALYRSMGVTPGDTVKTLNDAACAIEPAHENALKKAMQALLEGSKTDVDKGEAMAGWLAAPEKRSSLMPAYRRAFLTAKGDLYAKAATNAVLAAMPMLADIMKKEGERLIALDEKIQALRLAQINAALLTVSADMLGRYMAYKRETDRLDFDDLILKTCDLLSARDTVQWVLFKLDEGLDHILVDEAQDTSPYQWQVVQALAEEFFDGAGARVDTPRTLFVVGDEKQSIFSFQGADPAAFDKMQKFFGQKVRGLQEGWEVVLEYSFRSTAAVLSVVDGIFNTEMARKGVVADETRQILHRPFRAGHAGQVELWPLISPDAVAEAQDLDWALPLATKESHNPAALLAQRMAETIRGWLDSGEMLESRGRPVRPGDIMILVQSRNAIVELLMRALKDAGVPVAGVDRMTLTEEISVMDLLAVAQFALLPQDDLTLATVLKSPLVGMTEEELFDVCHGRATSLWAAMKDKRPELSARLAQWVERGRGATPYAFFASLLCMPCPADTVSGRRAFYARLGHDIQDALDEFLNSCLHYEQTHTPSLQNFVDWFTRNTTDIKREQDQHKADQVRIMTVHASKGLQAPIVFLPDTVKIMHDHNKGRARLLWPETHEGVPLWSPRKEFDTPAYTALQQAAEALQEDEYRRLLYVALTRAEDRLYIAGYHGKRAPKEGCWYHLIHESFPAAAQDVPFAEGTVAKRISFPQEVPPKRESAVDTPDVVMKPLPAWVFESAPEESFPPVPLAPSRPDEDEPAVRSPLGSDNSWRYRRGIIVHRLLEILPQLPEDRRAPALRTYVMQRDMLIPAEERERFIEEVMAVLTHPQFAPIFGPGSQAETPVVGQVGRQVISGQMDRILVTADTVMVVDYKTNRPPPSSPQDVQIVYLKQMATYRAIMRQVYPNHTVKCALLWTDGPWLMPLPDAMMDPYNP